jgi:hypothetical protein
LSVDGQLAKGSTVAVPAGNHLIKVESAGYVPFEQTVNVAAAMTLNVVLQPLAAQLTINVNALNAVIFLDGAQLLAPSIVNSDGTTSYNVTVQPGGHSLQVQAPTYLPYEAKVNVTGNMTVKAVLQAQLFTLNVVASAKGAAVWINGKAATLPAKLPAGDYDIQVSAPGFLPFAQRLTLNQDQTLNVGLSPMLFDLFVQCDVPTAMITVNDGVLNGGALKVSAGKYVVKAQAPGYAPFAQEIMVNGNVTLPIKMTPLSATIVITVPDAYVNKGAKGNHYGLMELWIDNVQVKLNKDRVEIQAGKHRIRFVTGGLSTEADLTLDPGQSYSLEATLQLKAVPILLGR